MSYNVISDCLFESHKKKYDLGELKNNLVQNEPNNLWLYNNNTTTATTSNNSNTTTTLIECILILSINGILIEYDNIVEYCNSVIQYKDNNKETINNNNKRSHIQNHDTTYETLLNGLNNHQFQYLYNNIIKSLTNTYKATEKGATTTPQSLNNHNNNYSDDDDKIKFD